MQHALQPSVLSIGLHGFEVSGLKKHECVFVTGRAGCRRTQMHVVQL